LNSGFEADSAAEVPAEKEWEYDASAFLPVTWFAPVLSGGGYCSEALSFAQALHPFLGGKLRMVQHGDSVNRMFLMRGMDERSRELLLQGDMLVEEPSPRSREKHFHGAVAICHSEPGAWAVPRALYSTSLCPPPQARIKIGRTMFETDRLPNGWAKRLNAMDAVWVPTDFARDVFARAGVEETKIRVVPEPVDSEFFSPEHARRLEAEAGSPFVFPGEIGAVTGAGADGADEAARPRPFRFLSVFKFEERKNWKGLVRAFVEEFAADTPPGDQADQEAEQERQREVVLYILTSAYHSDAAFSARISSFLETLPWDHRGGVAPAYLPPIRLLPSNLAATELVRLYAAVDCVVLPTRGEGWGRPHVEAMAMGLPLIATRWSGPEAFMTDHNSFPLSLDTDTPLVPVGEGAFKEHLWANPSRTHLRSLLRLVLSEPALASSRGAQARKDMVRLFCPRCVAEIVLRELARVQGIEPRASTLAAAAPAAATAAEADATAEAEAEGLRLREHEEL